jgi:hypothetical protein
MHVCLSHPALGATSPVKLYTAKSRGQMEMNLDEVGNKLMQFVGDNHARTSNVPADHNIAICTRAQLPPGTALNRFVRGLEDFCATTTDQSRIKICKQVPQSRFLRWSDFTCASTSECCNAVQATPESRKCYTIDPLHAGGTLSSQACNNAIRPQGIRDPGTAHSHAQSHMRT